MPAVVVVHGGAWAIPDELAEASVDGVKVAVREGYAALKRGGNVLDAVEAAVRAMEDNNVFNAGLRRHLLVVTPTFILNQTVSRLTAVWHVALIPDLVCTNMWSTGHGAVLNADGEVELDAIIMDGRTLGSGAVSSVQNIANPVTLARAVMEKTSHVMLTSRGANQFAESIGMVKVPTDALVSEYERKEWEKHKNYVTGVKEDFNSQWAHDTVGAVAVDPDGNVACATSTGGIRNKMVGRVGDSPIIGCGGFADNSSGAVSCTGHGESIMRVTLARLILSHVEQGKSVADSSQLALQHMAERVHGAGGAIAVSPSGQWAATFTTERMAWAAMDHEALWYGLDPNERFKEQLTE